MAPTEITLERTGDRPATFKGTLTTSFKSSNATSVDKESSSRQWFVIDLYQTAAGTQVAHIQYRAGSKLGREQPKDLVYTGKTLLELFDLIKMIDPADTFVTGRAAASQKANPDDAERWHATSCQYAKKEYTDTINKLSHYVTKVGGAEEII